MEGIIYITQKGFLIILARVLRNVQRLYCSSFYLLLVYSFLYIFSSLISINTQRTAHTHRVTDTLLREARGINLATLCPPVVQRLPLDSEILFFGFAGSHCVDSFMKTNREISTFASS